MESEGLRMVTVKMFGPLRLKTEFKNFSAELHSVREACAEMEKRTGFPEKEFKACVFMVNGTPAKIRTKLKDGDELVFLAPSGGG